MSFGNVDVFPVTAGINGVGHLTLGGCDTVNLAAEFGTPLYVFDEATLQIMCREFVREFTKRYPNTKVLYASKAYINPVLAKLVHSEGLGFDVVSGGEFAVVNRAGIPAEEIYFHGNNKTPAELEAALDGHIGRVVIDNVYELGLLNRLAGMRGVTQDILLRVSPGVDPHTHSHTTTGTLDSKFGLPIETGDAEKAVLNALDAPNLNVVGLHFHLGSPIFELEPYSIAIDSVLIFAQRLLSKGFELKEFSPGGGFAIGYMRDQLPPPIGAYADVIVQTLKQRAPALGLGEPKLLIEPGRSIVGRAGVALYTVGAIKDIASVRKYVSLDGGMGDNIRPALYDSRYEALVANRATELPVETVTLAGKYCESGDVLVRDVTLPEVGPGDIISIPSSGAYAPSMASNYNMNPRPAVVLVKNGAARLIRRRETYEEMMRADVL